MEVVALLIGGCLVALLVWTSRRWGPPRFYTGGVVAWWVIAAVLAIIVLRFALE